MQKINPLVKKYGKSARWVNYSMVPVKGRITKIPFSSVTGHKASSTEPKDWATYDQAKKMNADQIGIVFTPDQLLLGIDIDHCLDISTHEIDHEKSQLIQELLIQADTYTEISPSGTGLHLYLALTAPLQLSANKSEPFEVYASGRYFTVTQNPFSSAYFNGEVPVREVTPQQAQDLLAIIGYPWGKDVTATVTSTHGPSQHIDDTSVLKKMFASKTGAEIKALYDGDASQYSDDLSRADMALLAHLAFWTRRSSDQMLRLWLASPLGAREKTQNRKDYQLRSVQNAIEKCTEVYETGAEKLQKKIAQDAPDLDLLFVTIKGDKVFTQNTENMCRILRDHPAFAHKVRYDEFKNALEINDHDKWRDLADHDIIDIQTYISILFPCFGKVSKDMVADAILKVSRENAIDSAKDWIVSLRWDGTARLDQWLTNTYHTPDDLYHRAVASNWFKGLVKRITQPGCKFDYVLVLEGEQGIKKSTSLGVIGSPFPGATWHVETVMSTDNKDFFMQMGGKAIIEFSEGETFSRTEVKRMKGIITMQTDKYRPAYGRLSMDFPRRCVFAMTTNQTEYLKDETGNRRWLPVACEGVADIDWLRANLSQLYAEAFFRLNSLKETCHEFPEVETKLAQSTRRIHDPNEDLIADWYFNVLKPQQRSEGITIQQAYRDALCAGYPTKALDRYTEMAISGVLRDTLLLEKRRKMVEGFQGVRWFSTDKSVQSAEIIPLGEKQASQRSFNDF